MAYLHRDSVCRKNICKQIKVNLSNVNVQNNVKIHSAPLEENSLIFVKVGVNKVKTLVDTGAQISCVTQALVQRSFPNIELQRSKLHCVSGVCGEKHLILGEVELPVKIDGLILYHKFHVLQRLHQTLILGVDFLKAHQANLDFSSNILSLKNGFAQVAVLTQMSENVAKITKDTVIPPLSQVTVPVNIFCAPEHSSVLLEATDSVQGKYNLAGGKCLTKVEQRQGMYQFINPTNTQVTLPKFTVVAQVTSQVDEDSVTPLQRSNNSLSKAQRDRDIKAAQELGISLDQAVLSQNQKLDLLALIGKHRKAFAKDITEIGKTNLVEHTIETRQARPVASQWYRQTPKQREITEKITKEMLEGDIIEESTSPWHSPIVLVKKKKQSPDQPQEYRFAVDFRKLNAITEDMHYPLPRLEDIFDTLGNSNANMFSTLDLASGFWQIPLDPETKQKSAFVTHQGVFQFKRLPFGLKNAPMSFQALMSKVLKNLNFKVALVYIDDILVFSKDFNQHLEHLDLIFSTLSSANLTLKPTKCKFAAKEVRYLGHVLSKDGVRVDPEKTSAVADFPVPKTVKQVRSFLGMCNYYRKFVKDYAKIAQPLNDLLKKDLKFVWTKACEQAFRSLKGALTSAPILAFPDFSKPFIVSTDASDFAVGYVLGQLDDSGKREHAIAYGGRALHTGEKKWNVNEKEGLALIEAINTFRPYLEGSKFTVYTDNSTIKWIQSNKKLNSKVARWALQLQGYSFDVKHRAGVKNTNADGLSRREYNEPEHRVNHEDIVDVPGYPCKVNTAEVRSISETDKEYVSVTFEYKTDIHRSANVGQITQEDEEEIDENDINVDDRHMQDFHADFQSSPVLSQLQQQCPDFEAIY